MRKTIISILIIGLILLSSIGIAYRYAANQDFFFPQIKALVKESTGYVLEKTGPIEVSVFPHPVLIARELKASNPAHPYGADLLKTGRLALSLNWFSLLKLNAVVNIELDNTDLRLLIDDAGIANWSMPELAGTNSGLPFRLDKISARQTHFRLRNDQTNEIVGLDLEQLAIDLLNRQANAQINSAGRYRGRRFVVVGEAKFGSENKQLELALSVSTGEALDTDVSTIEAPSVSHWIENNAVSFPIHGTIQGAVSFRNSIPYGHLNIKAEAETLNDLSHLSEKLSYLRGEPGPVIASGVLQLNGSDLDISGLTVALQQEQLNIQVNGIVQNLLSEVRADLKISGRADQLDQLLSDKALSIIDRGKRTPLRSINVDANLSAEKFGTRISDMELHFERGSLNANVAGELRFVKEGVFSSLEVQGNATRMDDLLGLFGIEKNILADPEPFSVSAKISSENGDYTIEQGAVQTKDGHIKATASGKFSTAGDALSFGLDSSLKVKDVSRLVAIFPEDFQPHLQGIRASARAKIEGTMENFAIRDAEMDLFHNGATLHLAGRLSQLPDHLLSDINVRYTTETPVDLEQYFPKLTGFKLTAPLQLSGNVRAMNSKIFIQRINLLAEQTDAEGEIIVDLGLSPPRISATLNAGQFITRLFEREPIATPPEEEVALAEPNLEAEKEEAEPSAKELGERFKAYTSSIAINTDWIDELDLYFSFTADKAQFGNYAQENLALVIGAREGVFNLVKYEFMLDGRPISFKGIINTNSNPPSYEFAGKLNGDTLETLLNVEENLITGGELSGDFNLNSEGANLGKLIENLEGDALITMGPLAIRSNALNFVSSSIFSAMLEGLMLKKEDQPSSAYECGVLGVDINAGIARINKAFSLQAKDYNLAGNGTIDLNTGAVDIRVAPRARKGLGLSISTMIGGFKIKGNMATLDFGLGGGGFISAVVVGYALGPTIATGAAVNPATATIVATGYLLTGIASRMTASSYSCENTLKRIERNRLPEPTPPEPGPTNWNK